MAHALLGYQLHSSALPWCQRGRSTRNAALAKYRLQTHSRRSSGSHGSQHLPALRAKQHAGDDIEPSAVPDPLSHDDGRVSPPQTDAAVPQNATASSRKSSSKAQRNRHSSKYGDIGSPMADASRNVAALSGILGGLEAAPPPPPALSPEELTMLEIRRLLQLRQQHTPELEQSTAPPAEMPPPPPQQQQQPAPAQFASVVSYQTWQQQQQQQQKQAPPPPAEPAAAGATEAQQQLPAAEPAAAAIPEAEQQQEQQQQLLPSADPAAEGSAEAQQLEQQQLPEPAESSSMMFPELVRQLKENAASYKISANIPGQGTWTPDSDKADVTPAAQQPAGTAPAAAAASDVPWQVPEEFRPASAAAAAGRRPSVNKIIEERKFEKKVQAHLYESTIKPNLQQQKARITAKKEARREAKAAGVADVPVAVPKAKTGRALERAVEQAARAYLIQLGCCPPGEALQGGKGQRHEAFEAEVARAARQALAKQGIGAAAKPHAWVVAAKEAAESEAAAAAAEKLASKQAKKKSGDAANSNGSKDRSSLPVADANVDASSSDSGSNGKAISSSGDTAAADASGGSSWIGDAAAAIAATVTDTDSRRSSSSSSRSSGDAEKAASSGAVRVYRDGSSSGGSDSNGNGSVSNGDVSGDVPKRRGPSRPPAGASAKSVLASESGRAGGSGKRSATDRALDDRQRGIHDLLMKKWRAMKEGELSQEERTAQMKAALYESLKWQQWLNRAADKAAIAGRHEPPSSQPWRKRFRARKEAILEHYRERMERVTANANSSWHAESRGIPAVCTALAGARLLHLEIEQEARAAGVTIPYMLTLDAQWAVEDSLSGEVDRVLSEESAPPPEPQTFREEVGNMLKGGLLGRGDSKRQAAAAAPAPGLRIVNETRAIPQHQEFIDLLKEAGRMSEYWARQYEEFFVRKTLTRRSKQAKAEEETAAAESVAAGGTTSMRPAPRSTDAAAATAPSAGRVLQQMLGGMFGRRSKAEAELSARPQWSPPVPLTGGGGVVYSPPRGAAVAPRPVPVASGPRLQAMLQWKRRARSGPNVASFVATRQREQELFELGYQRVAGIDDSGVGSAAGPIVAAACLMPLDVNPWGIRDSKDLNNAERVQVFGQLVADPRIAFATCVVDAYVVDEVGGDDANMIAMYGAWRNLAAAQPDFVLIDGKSLPRVIHQLDASLAIPQGDRSDYVIAAASIIASVTRAKLMEQYARAWPQYNFERNWGHLDEQHRAALREHGVCPIHRVSSAVAALSGGARLREGSA